MRYPLRARIGRASVTFSCAVLAMTCAVLTPTSAHAAPAPSPWLHEQGSAAHSNANLAETTLSASTIGSAGALTTLAPSPKTEDGCGLNDGPSSFTSVLISQSRIYSTSGDDVRADNVDGIPLWRVDIGFDSGARVVAVSHGLVIVAGVSCGSVSDPNGYVIAYYADTGEFAYSLPIGEQLDRVSVSGKYIVTAGSYHGYVDLTVYRVQDGNEAWTTAGFIGSDGFQSTGGEVIGGKIFTRENPKGSTDTRSRARNLATGKVVPGSLPATEVVERGDLDTADAQHLYAHTDPELSGTAQLYDIDPATGQRHFSLAGAYQSLAVDSSRVYAACATDFTKLCGYDRDTGKRLWARNTPNGIGRTITANGVLYLSSGLVLDSATGQTLRSLPGYPAAVGQGRVAVVRSTGRLQLFGLAG